MKPIKIIIITLVIALVIIVLPGIIKFNVIGDDVIIDTNSSNSVSLANRVGVPSEVSTNTQDKQELPSLNKPGIQKESQSLLDNKWVFVETRESNENIQPNNTSFVLSFDKSNQSFSSTTDCNTGFSNYTLKDDTLTFGPIASTRMYCENSLEGSYFSILGATQKFSIEENTLRLISPKGIMIFKKLES